MSYLALYRKFRPDSFEDVKGQEHITTTLKNQIKAERIGHAYLFCGTRGTGKTTAAKIFAKAVNCEHPVDGSPCGECRMCRSIASGSSMNVIEIDAASNNGVDNIREIREEVAYRPTEGRYKVYIIDEVHMLSIGAFNALLKTLEEPPEYVIFILATTEVHKIPVTILSRCQRYDFRRIDVETISARLQELMLKEQVEVEDKAIRYIARAADGSMRDALSLLDQCIAFYLGEKLSYEHVLDVLGAVDTEVFGRLLRQIVQRDVGSLMSSVEELIMQGRELGQLSTDFTWYLRNLLLAKTSDNIEEVLGVSRENLDRMKEEAQLLEVESLLRYIRIFSELSGQLKYASQKRVLFEVALIKLCVPAMESSQDALLDRIRALEDKLERGDFVAPQMADSGSVAGSGARKEVSGTELRPEQATELRKAIPEEIGQVVQNFRSILKELHPPLSICLKKARLSLGGENRLLLVFDDEMDAAVAGQEEHIRELRQQIELSIGKSVEVEVRRSRETGQAPTAYPDLEKLIHMEITVED